VSNQPIARLLEPRLDALRRELEVPGDFSPEVLAEAEAAASRPVTPEPDERGIPLFTIDPPGSMDLDQAMHLERREDGFRVRYAIADVASFVTPGGAIDQEAHARGQTVYLPGASAPLHPTVLSEGAASLLPDQERPAILWTLDINRYGQLGSTDLRRALVRSRRRLDYEEAQAEIEAGGRGDEPLALLAEVGALRERIEEERGGITLDTPDQEVVEGDGGLALEYRSQLPVEGFNEQISLLTGIAAAQLMLDSGAGVLRTMPPPEEGSIDHLRRTARGLRIDWPSELGYQDFVRSLDAGRPAHAAMLRACTALLRGAAYASFEGKPPAQHEHAALATPYAHTTAPLRRLVDRYVLELCVAACAGERPPEWAIAALPSLPEEMQASGRRAGAAERAVVDLVEAAILAPRVGEEFRAVVVNVDGRGKGGIVQLADPPVIGRLDGRDLPLGEEVRVRLRSADLDSRKIEFTLA